MTSRLPLILSKPTTVVHSSGPYHDTVVTTLDSINIACQADNEFAARFALFVGITTAPPAKRPAILESLRRLRGRVVSADKPNSLLAITAIDGASTSVGEQQATSSQAIDSGNPINHLGIEPRMILRDGEPAAQQ